MGEPGQPAGGAAMILFLTTADTEVLALSRAVATLPDGFPRVRAANPSSGDPGEFVAASTAPSGTVAEAFGYLRHGGVGNLANLLRFVADTLLSTGFGFEPPVELPAVGLYPTATRDRPEPLDGHLPDRPLVGVVFYRAHWMSGNTAFIDSLVEALAAAGANPLPVFCYSLRPEPTGRIPACELLAEHGVDALV